METVIIPPIAPPFPLAQGYREIPEEPCASDSNNSVPTRLALALRAFAGIELRELLPDDEELPVMRDPDGPVPDCSSCNGRGFVRHPVPVGHPDFGKSFPCPCYAPGLQRKRLRRIYGRSEIPREFLDYTFASFEELDHADQEARPLVEEWASHGEGSLFLWGGVGLGKTGLAICALRLRAELHGCDVLYRYAPDLFDDLRRSFNHELGGLSSGAVFDVVRSTTLVLLDDVGKEQLTPWVQGTMARLLDYRWREHLPTIFTSNEPMDELEVRFGPALFSRVRSMCSPNVLELLGPGLKPGQDLRRGGMT